MTEEESYIRRSTFIMLGAGIGGYVIDYGFNLFLARKLDVHDYGDFKVAMAFLALSAVVVLLGGDRAALRYLPEWLESEDRGGVWEYVRTYLIVLLGLSVVLAGVTISLSVFYFGALDPQNHHPLLVASLVAPLAAVATLLGRVFLAAKRVDLAQVPWRIGYPLLWLAVVAVWTLLVNDLTDMHVLWTAMVVGLLVIGVQVFYLHRLGFMPIRRRPDLSEPKQWIAVSVPMMLVGLLQIGMSQTDLFVLEALGSTEAEVGHYGAATTTVYVLVLAQTVGVSVISPLISGALTSAGDALRELQARGFRLLFWLVALPGAVIIIFAPFWLSLFGPDFVAASRALVLLTVGYSVTGILALSPLWLQYSGKERVTMWVTMGVFVANIVLNVILVPIYGVDGAAFSTMASLTGAGVALSVLQQRHLGMSPWPILSVFSGLKLRKGS